MFLKTTCVAVFGLVTCVLTALLVIAIGRLTGFDILAFRLWFIPAGAIAAGIVAACGYYFGSLHLHARPNFLLLLQMVTVAAFSQLLIYYLQYVALLTEDGQRVSDLIPFVQYLEVKLTTANYRFGQGAQADGGRLEYWIAVIQFVGFLIAGLITLALLLRYPVCANCKMYLRVLGKADKLFDAYGELTSYHDRLFRLAVDSSQFAEMVRIENVAEMKKGAWKLNLKLCTCPGCKAQMIRNEVSRWNGNDWRSVDHLAQIFSIPAGVDLTKVFGADF